MVSTLHLFPEVYTHGERPPKCGVVDKQRLSLPTPAYGFGWVTSRLELFEALNIIDEPPMKMWLRQLPQAIDTEFYARWQANGYEDSNHYDPNIPEAKSVGEDFVLILLACNTSLEMMDSIMADKAYHDECRAYMNNPQTMKLEPAWFRVGLRSMPKDFVPGHQGGGQPQ